MMKNGLQENGMRKRLVGNYLKAYPHVYEAYKMQIVLTHVEIWSYILMAVTMILVILPVILFEDWNGVRFISNGIFCTMFLLFACIFLFLLYRRLNVKELISQEELELMEKDLASGKEVVVKSSKSAVYSTKDSFLIGFYRIPRKELHTVYMGCARGYYRPHINKYEYEFCYGDGRCISICVWGQSIYFNNKEKFAQMIRKYDDSVRIYKYQKMNGLGLSYPFIRLKNEVPFVDKAAIDELNILCSGNSLWKLNAKISNGDIGNDEVEIVLHGTVWTWLLWIVYHCLWLGSIFSAYFLPLKYAINNGGNLVILELFWPFVPWIMITYAFYDSRLFSRNARKITDKAVSILYRDFSV